MMWFRRSEFDRYALLSLMFGQRNFLDGRKVRKQEIQSHLSESSRNYKPEYNTSKTAIKHNEHLKKKLGRNRNRAIYREVVCGVENFLMKTESL